MSRTREWLAWAAGVIAGVFASAVVWFYGGMAWCPQEDYDSGSSLCGVLVGPFWPWAVFSLAPTFVAAIGGFVALRRGRSRLFKVALFASIVVAVLAVLLLPAIY